MELKPKISIIGAGNVGVRFAYAAAIKGTARHIVMIDNNQKKLEANILDIDHGAPFYPVCDITSGSCQDIKGSQVVVVTAGIGQKPGQTRLDLIKDNIEVFKQIIPEVMKYAEDSIILIVSNPVDILSYAAYKISGKKPGSVFGSGTVLDSARLRFLLGKHCRVDSRNIHAYILGEHGDSEFPCWSKAMIGGVFLNEYCAVCKMKDTCKKDIVLSNIFNEVKNSAYKIIEGKGETSYGIGLAMERIVHSIIKDENSILPVSYLVEDFYGVSGVYIGVPCIVNSSGVREVLNIELNPKEQELFKKSAESLKSVIKTCGL